MLFYVLLRIQCVILEENDACEGIWLGCGGKRRGNFVLIRANGSDGGLHILSLSSYSRGYNLVNNFSANGIYLSEKMGQGQS